MSPFRKRKERRRILDVHFRPLHEPKKLALGLGQFVSRLWGSEEILDLRQNVSRRPEFRIFVAFLTIGILLFSFQRIFIRAEVADFFPSTCLGTWENPQSAQGEPQTFLIDATAKILSASNSAAYAGGESQVFCGGFIPAEYEMPGTIDRVGITLVLQVGDIKEAAPAAAEVQATSTEPIEVQITPSSTEPAEAPPLPEEPTQPELKAPPSPDESTPTTSFLERLRQAIVTAVFAQEENPPAPTPPLEPTPPAPEPTPPSQDTPPVVRDPEGSSDPERETSPPAPELIEPKGSSEPERPASLEAPVEESSSTSTIIAPPIFAPLLPIETQAETSSAPESEPPVSVTSSEPVQISPPSPDEHFLKVSYSIDGELWVEAGKINPVNWPHFTFTLPVTSWDELKKLQVRIEGIPTALPYPLPPVYLDGMLLEVNYEVTISPGAIATSTPSAVDSQADSQLPKPKLVTFDSRSTHTCRVEPFSQTLPKGAAISYQVKLKPSRPLANFELLTGDLPSGITAAFDQSKGWAGAEQTLTVEALSNAEAGSFNAVVVYREQSDEGELLPNFCQLNLIVE